MLKNNLTIVIPTFNSAKYINKTLECLKKQTKQNFTIFIIDDNSTDDTQKIAEKFPNVSFFQKNKKLPKGAAASLNYILKKITSPYLALIDSDTYLHENWTETMSKILEKEKIVGAPILADKKNGLVAYLAGLEIESRYENLPKTLNHLSTCNLALQTKILKDFKFNENLFYAYDHQLSFYLRKNKIKFYLTRQTYCHHGNKNSLKNYLVQQYQITKNHMILSKKMSKEAVKGDEISPNYLILQPPLTLAMILFLFYDFRVSLICFILLLLLNNRFFIYLNKKSKTVLLLPAIGLTIFRNIMWSAGFVKGLFS